MLIRIQFLVLVLSAAASGAAASDHPDPRFNRAPLAPVPYAELPLGAIEPRGWLLDELRRMAAGMTGHLDEWYPEVAGPRNAWLGGDGDTWERGPYWIDGLYPLARLLRDANLTAKAMQWIEWTLRNQREDGYIGPRVIDAKSRRVPPPKGAQVHKPDDWWPRMVMLKILQQHYGATRDPRVLSCLQKYFAYQLKTLPGAPLHDPKNPRSGSWWAAERGGDNILVVLWLYNETGDPALLDLARLLAQQTIPFTAQFLAGERISRRADQPGSSFHCVNLAQALKTPLVISQFERDPRHLAATQRALQDIATFHGQPHGMYGGDEGLHGDAPDRGSELCSAVEMMFSLEKIVAITGAVEFADRLEQVAFNLLPTQVTPDHRGRQYFQQVNQVQVTHGDRDFFNDNQDRLTYSLLGGYPCCTANYHQGWPKFAAHLWLASADGGLAAIAYAPNQVTATVAGGVMVKVTVATDYPFRDTIEFTVETAAPVAFPLHLRIPQWCETATVKINGHPAEYATARGTMAVLARTWRNGDRVELRLPMKTRVQSGYARSVSVHRGPLLFALDIPGEPRAVARARPEGVPASAPDRGYLEFLPTAPWNYALTGRDAALQFEMVDAGAPLAANPWSRASVPIELRGRGVRIEEWGMLRNSAAPPPLSPLQARPGAAQPEPIRLIPYGATTLRVAAFPWIGNGRR
jgi:DUF1680 family protein